MPPFAMKQANVEAKLIKRAPGHCLAVDFRESVPPVIWHLNLAGNPGATVTLRGRDDEWTLGLAEPKGEFTAIAHFDNRDDAEEAYAAVQKALMRGCCGHGIRYWVLSILMVLIVVAAIITGIGLISGSSSRNGSSSGMTRSSGQQMGVPVPADEVLKAPLQ